jgi:hypothetical protein
MPRSSRPGYKWARAHHRIQARNTAALANIGVGCTTTVAAAR